MTDPLDILIGHLQGLAEQIDIALSAARALRGQDDSPSTLVKSDHDMPETLAPKEAAHLAKRSESTIIRWCDTYEIGKQVGGRYFISKQKLMDHLDRLGR
ncbi:helix-turn-helix domain-containing protein [Mesorhizobium kowhaii]|uniref:Helix-turn-helix domain-containing protein n=1 Tax=Mesorhizobium kowhaii TaxID=1300272 RepID=A0A2W7BRE2_9HYPH|nr:helix-turn-helix domain-containing protein [Mesorhizobium kowhaii]PZV33380.1 hypothetical protein B5V02_39360 [Mesorhizobium kowhaii]